MKYSTATVMSYVQNPWNLVKVKNSIQLMGNIKNSFVELSHFKAVLSGLDELKHILCIYFPKKKKKGSQRLILTFFFFLLQ